LGNVATKEVHDLDDGNANCQIDEIIGAEHDLPFTSLQVAHEGGYDNCAWCLAGSKR